MSKDNTISNDTQISPLNSSLNSPLNSSLDPHSLKEVPQIPLDDDEEDDIRPIHLQTDSHILTCFKAKRLFGDGEDGDNPFKKVSNDPPYYMLVDKRRPDEPVSPLPIQLTDILEITGGVDKELKKEEHEEVIDDGDSDDGDDNDDSGESDDDTTNTDTGTNTSTDANTTSTATSTTSTTAKSTLPLLPSKFIHISLAGNPIGEISINQKQNVLDFISQWNDQLTLVSELSIISRPPLEQSASAKFLNNLKKTIGLSNNEPDPTTYTHRSSLATLAEVESLAREIHTVSITELRDRQLIQERNKFLKKEDITVKAITWNVHGEKITNEDLNDLLKVKVRDSKKKLEDELQSQQPQQSLADIYIFCLQESDPLSKNLYANSATLQSTTEKLLSYLPDHIEVVHNQLLGLMTIVLVHCRLAPQLSSIELASTGTGLFGVWGNKGAIVVRFTLGHDPIMNDSGTQFAIINCHLSAGDGQVSVDRRRWELSEISNKFSIDGLVSANNDSVIFDSDAHELSISDDLINKSLGPVPSLSISPSLSPSVSPPATSTTSRKPIQDKCTLLLGDLNFRVSLQPPEIVQDFANRRDYETVLIHDTLTQEIKSRKILQSFKEGMIKFPPTYRYNIGDNGNLYDLERIPSYTDRILYSNGSNNISQLDYSSHQSYTISDHKPVSSLFNVKVELIDFEERNDIVTETLKKLDKAENAARPVITVEPLELTSTGLVLHPQEVYTTISHSSTLSTQANSRIIEWDVVSSDPNIKVFPEKGVLPAGGSQRIKFTTTLGVMNSGGINTKYPLQRVIVISIKDVQDIFVSLEFNVLPTCLGAPLDLLCRMPDGARKGIKDSATSSNMPKEICNCIDYLWNHVASTPDMFWKPGDEAIENQIQEWMDNGQDFDTHVLDTANELQNNIGVYSVANQFLLLLRYISGGIIPVEYYYIILRGAPGVNVLLESLSNINVNVLLYIVGFLAKAIEQGINEKKLLDLFEPLLISIPRTKDNSKSRSVRREFLKQLINP